MAEALTLRHSVGMISYVMPGHVPFHVGIAGIRFPTEGEEVIVDVPAQIYDGGRIVSTDELMRAFKATAVDRATFVAGETVTHEASKEVKEMAAELEMLRAEVAQHPGQLQAQHSQMMTELTRKDGQIRLLEEKISLLEKPKEPPEAPAADPKAKAPKP